MASFTQLNTDDKYFIDSSSIYVFPCAYRGKDAQNDKLFDPESRLNTEQSFLKLSNLKHNNSYIISWNSEQLEFVIGGYYFVIKGITSLNYNFAYIRPIDINISTSESTKVLGPLHNESVSVDSGLDIEINGTYYFVGLCFTNTAPNTEFYLELPNNKDNFITHKSRFGISYEEIKSTLETDSITGNLVNGAGNYSVAGLYKDNNNTVQKNTASGNYSFAEGYNTTASGIYSHAEGHNTTATGGYSHTEGSGTTASSAVSHAEGTNTVASHNNAHAEGGSTKASGYSSHAEGQNTQASGSYSHAEGYHTTAGYSYQHVSGKYNDNKETTLFEVGNGTSSVPSNAFEVYQDGHAEAGTETITENNSNKTLTTKKYVDDINTNLNTLITEETTRAEGIEDNLTTNIENEITRATAAESSLDGRTNGLEAWKAALNIEKGSGDGSLQQKDNTASGDHAFAEGSSTQAVSNYSHAEGFETHVYSTIGTTSGTAAHAEGYQTITYGNYSHTEGYKTEISSSAEAAHAEGYKTKTYGKYSHAEGYSSTTGISGSIPVSGTGAHAEGYNTTASNDYSHAEGYYTTASGLKAHAEGDNTKASGEASHAEGYHTTANHKSQHVFGEFNATDDSTAAATARGNYVEIVGNGASGALSNARTLDWNGNEWLAGNIELGTAGSRGTLTGNVTGTASRASSLKVIDNYAILDYQNMYSSSNWFPFYHGGGSSDSRGSLTDNKLYFVYFDCFNQNGSNYNSRINCGMLFLTNNSYADKRYYNDGLVFTVGDSNNVDKFSIRIVKRKNEIGVPARYEVILSKYDDANGTWAECPWKELCDGNDTYGGVTIHFINLPIDVVRAN